MSGFISSKKKLGILGGGQLGKMLIQAASRWDINCCVLDPAADCPSAHLANEFTLGKFNDFDAVYSFGRNMDVLTIEIENVNTDALRKLREEGVLVHPSPEVIDTIKDKGKQKNFYRKHKLATSEFEIVSSKEVLLNKIESGELTYPFVQKLCREGYDGRGVAVIKSKSELNKILDGESVIEPLVNIQKEISVILSRNEDGEINAFPPVEMEFSEEANLVEMLIAPARIDAEMMTRAEKLGRQVIEALDLVGVMAVEMFLTKEGELLINESAPRPHNSGHHTIEANESSQYEQHLRAILGYSLGSTAQKSAAVMINVLGSKGFTGRVNYVNAETVLQSEGAHLHIYGKKQTKPFRKMGHITICGKDIEGLMVKAGYLKKVLRVEAK
jgi:5-(carboxyamino)imidazole ribonucleotide synthase